MRRLRICSASLGGAVLVAALAAAPAGAQTSQQPGPMDARAAFKAADLNGDGRLDREEFHRWLVERFYFLDAKRKGYLERVDITWVSVEDFRAADKNGDGKLSLQEYVSAYFVHFEAADRDKDGTLSLEEVLAYDEQMRRAAR